jgi:hypothetical protein
VFVTWFKFPVDWLSFGRWSFRDNSSTALWSSDPNFVAVRFDLAANQMILCPGDFRAICFCVDSWVLDSPGCSWGQSTYRGRAQVSSVLSSSLRRGQSATSKLIAFKTCFQLRFLPIWTANGLLLGRGLSGVHFSAAYRIISLGRVSNFWTTDYKWHCSRLSNVL